MIPDHHKRFQLTSIQGCLTQALADQVAGRGRADVKSVLPAKAALKQMTQQSEVS